MVKRRKIKSLDAHSEGLTMLRNALIAADRLSPDADEMAMADAVVNLINDFINYLQDTGTRIPCKPPNMSAGDYIIYVTADTLDQWTDEVLQNNWDPLRTSTTH